jgi:A/G-specific adenine glycosylase
MGRITLIILVHIQAVTALVNIFSQDRLLDKGLSVQQLPSSTDPKIADFKTAVYTYYRQAGRHFPWRESTDPWAVLVSEFMLQQTQTERVIPFFERWMQKWSTPEALNAASLEETLREWVGLGYNRRCRFLKDCARIIVTEHKGQVPQTPEILRTLPGIGEYTSKAIACFAFNYPSVFIETNIRSAVIHFFFQTSLDAVSDKDIVPLLEASLDKENPRIWYWALMDYGALLKKKTSNPNRRSAHYTKQSKFEGSFRQIRGGILKSLVQNGASTAEELKQLTGTGEADIYKVLSALERDLMVSEENGIYRIGNT